MNLIRNHKLRSSFDITPLVDMVFLLIIYFMVSTTFILHPGLKINLPSAKTSDAQPEKDIIITITPDSRIFVNQKEISLNSLSDEIRRKIKETNKDMVIIKGDKTIKYDLLISVMDEARIAGVNKINLSTIRKEK